MGIIIIFLTIALSGAAGGLGRFVVTTNVPAELIPSPVRTQPNINKKRRQAIYLGVIAAFVVPVFLSIASVGSNEGLITKLFEGALAGEAKADKWWSQLLILVGLCIVASYGAQSFLDNMHSALLKKLIDQQDEQAGLIEQSIQIANNANRKGEEALKSGPNTNPDTAVSAPVSDAAMYRLAELLRKPGRSIPVQSGGEQTFPKDLIKELLDRAMIDETTSIDGTKEFKLNDYGRGWAEKSSE